MGQFDKYEIQNSIL